MTPAEIVVAHEIVAAFMEKRPKPNGLVLVSDWWKMRKLMTGTGEVGPFGAYEIVPVFEVCKDVEKLGLVREVEKKLSASRWPIYRDWLCDVGNVSSREDVPKCLIHASAEEKLIALSQVLGPEVKKP